MLKRSARDRKIEGYWYSKYEPQYPMPVAGVLTEEKARIVFDAIKQKEKIARVDYYRGNSRSRIEPDTILGYAEYNLDGWVWPGDFAEHYVLKHRVRPTEEFLEFIGVRL